MICIDIPYDREVARIVAQVGLVGCVVILVMLVVAGYFAIRMELERAKMPWPTTTLDHLMKLRASATNTNRKEDA